MTREDFKAITSEPPEVPERLKLLGKSIGPGTVYMLTLPDGKKYIGLSDKKDIAERLRSGKNYKSNKELDEAINGVWDGDTCIKPGCGWENVRVEIVRDGIPTKYEDFAEKLEIAKYGTLWPNGYNKTTGGRSGYVMRSSKCRPVWKTDLETGERLRLYLSCASASRATEISETSIKDTAHGNQRHAGGFGWVFATPEEVKEWQQHKRQREIIA